MGDLLSWQLRSLCFYPSPVRLIHYQRTVLVRHTKTQEALSTRSLALYPIGLSNNLRGTLARGEDSMYDILETVRERERVTMQTYLLLQLIADRAPLFMRLGSLQVPCQQVRAQGAQLRGAVAISDEQ